MTYSKPIVKHLNISVKVNTNASDRSSCEGGHCVKASFKKDPYGINIHD